MPETLSEPPGQIKGLRAHARGGPEQLIYEGAPKPPAPDAAGVAVVQIRPRSEGRAAYAIRGQAKTPGKAILRVRNTAKAPQQISERMEPIQ